MTIELNPYIERVKKVANEVENRFGSLTEDQLNWKQSSKTWSIAECIDHLIVINSCYFEEFRPVAQGKYKIGLWRKINPFTNIVGRTMVKTLGPDRNKSYTTPKLFEPAKSAIAKDIISRFEQNQQELIGYLQSFKDINNDIIINSPVSTVITLKLQDAIQILVGHEERHLLQALDLMASKDFPSNE